jgi:thiamine transport system substrate-binding protein
VRRALLATGVAAAMVLAAACVAEEGGSEPTPDTVTLLTHDSFDVTRSVLEAFERSSGIRVRVLRVGDAGQLVNRAILTAGNPEGDVLFGVDNNLLAEALEADVFVPYASPRLDSVPDALELDPEHRVTPIDRGDVCLNYDRRWFEQRGIEPPSDLADLTSPTYRGLTVVENPATSTPGLAFLLATIARFGEDGWESYWRALRANDVLVTDGWESAYFGEFSGAGGGEGSRPIVVSYATSPVAEVVFAEEPIERPPTGVVTSSCFEQIEFAGILRGARNPEGAERLIDFLLSRRFQEDIPLRMFVYPVATDAELPPVFREHAVQIPRSLSLSPDAIAAGRRDWVERWTQIVLR